MERTGWCWLTNKAVVDQHHFYCFALSRSRFAPGCAEKRWLRGFLLIAQLPLFS
jgi:hypothetical protein